MAGFSDEVQKEVRKHMNAGAVVVGQMKGGEYVVAGSSDDPIFFKTSFKSGAKGSDKRGYTLKGDSNGMTWDLPRVPEALIANLELYA